MSKVRKLFRSGRWLGLALVGLCAAPTAADEPKPANVALEVKGIVHAARQARLVAHVEGFITRLHVGVGDDVKKGDVLAQLDERVKKAELDRARARLAEAEARLAGVKAGVAKEEVDRARAELAEAEAQAQLAKAEVDRAKALPGGAISRGEIDAAIHKVNIAAQRVEKQRAAVAAVSKGPTKDQVEVAAAMVMAARAEVEFRQLNLEFTTLQAPFDGVITNRLATEGTYVTPDRAHIDGAVYELADLANLEVVIDVPERDFAKLAAGQKCLIRADALPTVEFRGDVATVGPTVDPAKATVPVRIKVAKAEQSKWLRPGMSVVVRFLGDGPKN